VELSPIAPIDLNDSNVFASLKPGEKPGNEKKSSPSQQQHSKQ